MHHDLSHIEPIIIASLLNNPKWIRIAASKLDPEDFEKGYLGDIFQEMVILHQRKKVPTRAALKACMEDDEILDVVSESAFPEAKKCFVSTWTIFIKQEQWRWPKRSSKAQ